MKKIDLAAAATCLSLNDAVSDSFIFPSQNQLEVPAALLDGCLTPLTSCYLSDMMGRRSLKAVAPIASHNDGEVVGDEGGLGRH